MPNIDMPLEQLKKYKGCSPKTHDFEEFWSSKINRIKGNKVEFEMIEADFQLEGVICYNLIFKGEDGANIYCKYVRPKKTVSIQLYLGFMDIM